jgi:hypothetical protein
MKSLHNTLVVGGAILLSGCATQTYTARHATTSQLAGIHDLHVVSVMPQEQLDAENNTMYLNAVPLGAVTGAALAGGLIGGVIVSAEANHEAKVFADQHVAPLQTALAGHDGRADIRQTLEHGIHALPVRVTTWKVVDGKTNDGDLLPATASPGSAWLILRTRYAMTPDFSGLQVITRASLYVDAPSIAWQRDPVYRNTFTYQSALLEMPPKSDAERQRMAATENARYAKLDIEKQIAKVNAAGDAYDFEVAHQRQSIQDAQWRHQAKLKQIASPAWSADERADWYVKQLQANRAAALKQDMSEGGQQTARMLVLDITQPQPDADSKSDWRTVYHDAQRSIQDAPDGEVYSVANGDITHGAARVNQTFYFNAPVAAAH